MGTHKNWWHRQLEIYRSPQFAFATCLGTLAGAAFAAPLFGWSLPDGPSNVIGAALGAAAAVFGAEHMQSRRERSGRRELARITQRILDGSLNSIERIRVESAPNMAFAWIELQELGKTQLARLAPLGMSQANLDPTAVLMCSELELAWQAITSNNTAMHHEAAANLLADLLPKLLQALKEYEDYNHALL